MGPIRPESIFPSRASSPRFRLSEPSGDIGVPGFDGDGVYAPRGSRKPRRALHGPAFRPKLGAWPSASSASISITKPFTPRLRPDRTVAAERSVRIWHVLHALLAIVAVGIALRTGLLSKALPAVEAKPVGALAFMQDHGLHGNVLCEYGWASYLIWHDAPRSRVFIESLFETYYPHAVQDDYAALNYAEAGGARVLDAYPNDFVLMPTGLAAYRLMMAQAGWRLIYRDPVSALFARAGSPATQLAGVPDLARTAPPSVFP